VNLPGKYLNLPPPIFLKLSGLKNDCNERYPNPKLAARIHSFLPLNQREKLNEENAKTRKLPEFQKRLEISQNLKKFSLRCYFLMFYKE